MIHTSPPAFGKVMSTIEPREAIGYHFFNERATHDNILEGVRTTYDGPLTLATDNMVWNITKDYITVRDIVSPDQAWAVNGPEQAAVTARARVSARPADGLYQRGQVGPAEKAQAPMVNEFKKENGVEVNSANGGQEQS